MYRCSIALIAIVLSCATAFSQKIPLINSGEVLQQAETLGDSGKYADAIRLLETVPAADTNYILSQVRLTSAHYLKEDYDQALALTQRLLAQRTEYRAMMLRLQAAATARKGELDKAVALFEQAMKAYPTDVSLPYQLGLAYYNAKQYDKAAQQFFYILSINPFHTGSHLNLGRIAVLQGRKTHGIMSFAVYMAINFSDNERLVLLNTFLDNGIPEEGSIAKIGANGAEKLDQVLRAKIAMDKKFKSNFPVNAPVVRQLEMFFDQLGTISTNTNDPWVTFYLPLYKAIKDRQLVEPFVYHLLSSSSNDDARKWRSKNEKALNAFYETANQQLTQQRKTILVPALGYPEPVQARYAKSHQVESVGEYINDKPRGHWIYFHDNHEKSAEGDYNAEGKKKGTWNYYFRNGSRKSEENYETGEVTVYTQGGARSEHFFLKDDEIDGAAKQYYAGGPLRTELNFKAGKRHGKGRDYGYDGKLFSEYEYVEGKANGPYVSYFSHGQVQVKATYVNDEYHGAYKRYYSNGKLSQEGEYVNGYSTGLWKYYHRNGRLSYSGRFDAKGMGIGEWLYYDSRGQLTEKRIFNENGEMHGDNPIYHEGKLHLLNTFKKGLLIRQAYYTPDGKELFKAGNNNGTFTTKTFFATGEPAGEGAYKDGEREGVWKYFTRYGKLKSEFNYKAGKRDGEAREYYPSGEVKIICQYKNGELDGYYQEFYRNGKVKQEGWYQQGEGQQRWLEYHPNGTVASEWYLLNGDRRGLVRSQNYDGSRWLEQDYAPDGTGLSDVRHYNEKDEMITVKRREGFVDIYEDFYTNKKLRRREPVLCGNYGGVAINQYPDGTPQSINNWRGGRRHGDFKSYTDQGKMSYEGQYDAGEATGLWKNYFENGNVRFTGYYLEDERDSVWTYYHRNGKVSSVSLYEGGLRQGVSRFYGPDGELLLEKLYDEDDLIAYRAAVQGDASTQPWQTFKGNAVIEVRYPNGKLAWHEEYRNGMLHASDQLYWSNGNLYEEYTRDYGDYEGPYRFYDANGKLLEQGTFKDDELEGKVEMYNPDGTLQRVTHYVHGERHGPMTTYKNGKKEKEMLFWYGQIQE